ncbi:transposase [candidate division KSB1 bacterium]|nr:transposase [candidate division KSB1 bacterium]
MPDYIRVKIEGGTYFFTVVTYNRQPVFNDPHARELLKKSINNTRRKYSFKIIAICLMPDHIHCIWQLPPGDFDYSLRWRSIKGLFTREYCLDKKNPPEKNPSRTKRRERYVWQRRFWEHTIRNEKDLYTHIDYIHYNPVKHGYVKNPLDWPWSSVHKFVELGLYDDLLNENIFMKLNNKNYMGE